MKKIIVVLMVLLVSPSSFASYEWQTFDVVKQGNQTILKIEIGVQNRKNWRPKVKWRVTNLSGESIYNCSLGSKAYTLNNGRRVNRTSEGCGQGMYERLSPGQSHTTYSDSAGDEGTSVTYAELSSISFSWSKDSERMRVNF